MDIVIILRKNKSYDKGDEILNRRVLSLLLIIAILFGMLPMSNGNMVFAIGERGDHLTQVPPGYIGIYTIDDLNNVRNILSGNYILMNEIDLTVATAVGGTYYNNEVGWRPIGTSDLTAFSGIFDGNGYTIKGLKINITSSSDVYIGLFGCNIGTIKNIGMINGSIIGTSSLYYVNIDVGSIVGKNNGGTISNCYNTGIISIGITKLNSKATIGGVAGENITSGTISNCYNTGNMSALSKMNVSTAGGIVGFNGNGNLSNCYNSGSVNANSNSDSYPAYAGGIIGDNYGIISNCNYLDITSKGVGRGTDTATKCTLDQMKQQSTYVGFDFEGIWDISSIKGYQFPTLLNVTHIEREENMTDFKGGNGTSYNPFKISTKAQLNEVRNYPYNRFKLLNMIVFTAEDFLENGAYNNNGAGWIPIGNETNPFKGFFDGNGYTVKGIQVNISSYSNVYAGLFGFNTGVIKNLGVIDGSISATTTNGSTFVGGIAGYSYDGGVISCCYNTGIVLANATTANSYDPSAYSGGIVGCSGTKATISNCYNTGSVSSNSNMSNARAGGIVGSSYDSPISNCYNTGQVSISTTSTYAGGIAGYSFNGTYSNCYFLDIISKGTGYGTDNSRKCTLEQMKTQETFIGFDFITDWIMSSTYLPYFKTTNSPLIGYKNGILSGVDPNTKQIDLKNQISLLHGEKTKIFDKNNIEITNCDTTVTTGMTAQIIDANNVANFFTLIIYGDLDSDGDITITDLSAIKQHLLNSLPLVGAFKTAGDTNGVGNISISDLIVLKKHLLGIFTIEQRVPVIGVSLNTLTTPIIRGSTYNLTAKASPSNANISIIWSSSNGNATVDSNGVVTGVALGTATITAKTADGLFIATCEVTVTPIQVAWITALPTTAVAYKFGAPVQLVTAIWPSNADNKGIIWTSSNTNVATISSDGLVTQLAIGTTVVTAKSAENNTILTTCTVKVTFDPNLWYTIKYQPNPTQFITANATSGGQITCEVASDGTSCGANQKWKFTEVTSGIPGTYYITNQLYDTYYIYASSNSSGSAICNGSTPTTNGNKWTTSESTTYTKLLSGLGTSTYIRGNTTNLSTCSSSYATLYGKWIIMPF